MGSEIRKLAYDGYPASNIIGVDLIQEFISGGFKLYRDRDTTPISFIAADILTASSTFEPLQPSSLSFVLKQATTLQELKGTITHICVIRMFNLFDEETQYEIAKRLAVFLKREKGAIVFGQQGGFAQARKFEDPVQWK